jgi:hypothetical protein
MKKQHSSQPSGELLDGRHCCIQCLTSRSAGIGFGPNGLQAMDMIEPKFRTKYEQICVGNKTNEARHVFFEGLLLEPGLGRSVSYERGSFA